MESDRAEIRKMQAGIKAWVERTASNSRRGLREHSPLMLLSLLCAAALSPLAASGAGVAAVAGVVGSVGSGVLAGAITSAIEHLRRGDGGRAPGAAELEEELASRFERALSAGDASARAARAEIAEVLGKTDATATMLRAAVETGNEQVRSDVIAVIEVLGSGFADLGFQIGDVARAAAQIQKSLDERGAEARAHGDQLAQQSVQIRRIREDLELIEQRTRAKAADGEAGGVPVPGWEQGCPYRGLAPFNEEHEAVFCGRARLITELAVKLTEQLSRSGLVVVTGASGAGKSSLLRAGLLPVLARGQQVQGSARWPRIVLTPTRDPLTELATRLAVLSGTDMGPSFRDRLAQDPGKAQEVVREALLRNASRSSEGDARLVLIVDQFEQVFTLDPGVDGEAGRHAFIAALCAAAKNPPSPDSTPSAVVVIAVRGDFWDRCAAYPELASELEDGQFVVGPMTESDLRQAIAGPAAAAGLEIDPGLPEAIIRDLRAVGGEVSAGALPLLSQAMLLTWENREGNRLTSTSYELTSGLGHAIETSANTVYDQLAAEQQGLARQLLRSMTVSRPRRPVHQPPHGANSPVPGISHYPLIPG